MTPLPGGADRGTPGANARAHDDGTGLIATVSGVAVFIVLLLFAVQVAFDLYARSAVTAAALSAVTIASAAGNGGNGGGGAGTGGGSSGGTAAAIAAGENRARSELGGYGKRVGFRWEVSGSQVALTVTLRLPSMLPASITGALGLNVVRRTVEMPLQVAPRAAPSGTSRESSVAWTLPSSVCSSSSCSSL
ncbi:MAG: hypothetical protein ACYDH5_10495 [Acidimicrobiales bacterium]